MGQLTEFFMKSAGGPPPNMGFSMPMMKGWVPRRIQPWLYVLTAFCFQFSGGIYLGALDGIRGTTNFMIEDVLFLLYATLAGMAVYFSYALPHEVPLHQPAVALRFGHCAWRMQCVDPVWPVDAPTGGGLFHCRNGQNTRNVRVYEQHPTLDYSQTRFCSLLPCTPHYLAHGD